jgi:transglutaminase-like putative cysteine protease
MKRRALPWSIGAVLLLSGVCASAATEKIDPADISSRVKLYEVLYRLNADGTYTTERTRAVTLLKEQALEYGKQTTISYSTSAEKSEVLAAYTLKADGRRIDSPTGNYQVEANSGKDKSAAAFSDRTSMTVIFPDVAVGDTVVLSYRIATIDPIFPKHFSTVESFGQGAAYDRVRVKFDAPATLWTQFAVKDLKQVQNTEKDGRRIQEWAWENKEPVKSRRANYSVWEMDEQPGILFSTFRSHAEIAENYGLRARPKAAVTDQIRKLADEITQGKTSREDMARALYEWVARNISYAGNCVGIGTVVPRDLDFVLGNRMGDCKDHATLLQALLSAKGMDSTQALINSGSSYRLQKVPVVSMVNHVINYIPSLNLYLDSTASTTPFGMLPFGDADKPVLHVDGYKDGTKTPRIAHTANVQIVKTNMRIADDGSVKVNAVVDLKGDLAVSARDYFRDLNKEDEADLFKSMFQQRGLEAKGRLSKDDPKPLLGSYRYGADFEVKSYFDLPGPGGFILDHLMFNQRPVAAYIVGLLRPIEDTAQVSCVGGRAEEEFLIELPANIRVTAMPADLSLESGPYKYVATYKRVGRKLTVKRSVEDRTEGQVCAVSQENAHKAFADKVARNLRGQLLFQPATGR